MGRIKSFFNHVAQFFKGVTNPWWLNSNSPRSISGSQRIVSDPLLQHAWFNICVSKIAGNFSRSSFHVTYREEPEKGPWTELFRYVNPRMSQAALWKATVSWLQKDGEAFWSFGSDYTGGIPEQIIVMNPRYMKHHLNQAEDEIIMWEYQKEDLQIMFLPSEIVHFKEWNPWDQWRGRSSITALMEEVNQDVKSLKSNSRLLDAGGIVPGVLSSPNKIDPNKVDEIRAAWRRQHSGYTKHYDVAVLGQGLEYKEIGLKPEDMQYIDLSKINTEKMLARLGVPPAVAGIELIGTALSGEQLTAALKAFWILTLEPLQKEIEDRLRTDLFGRYAKQGTTGVFDNSGIAELQADLGLETDRALKEIAAGTLTRNEWRESQGLDPLPWGDTWYKPIALRPVEEDTAIGQEPPAEPPPEDGKSLQDLFLTETKGLTSFFPVQSRTKSLYTSVYKTAHWWELIHQWENIEDKYKKQLQAWFRGQRGAILENLYTKSKSPKTVEETFDDDFWKDQYKDLQEFSGEVFNQTLEVVGDQMTSLFTDLDVTTTFNIFDSRAVELLDTRINKGNLATITETVRDEIMGAISDGIKAGLTEDELADKIRGVYNKANNRAATIARTEISGVINDSRTESFKEVGFEKHSWLSAMDGNVRGTHTIDGETVVIGKEFSNGLTQPGDPNGAAEEVINCRCVTMPED